MRTPTLAGQYRIVKYTDDGCTVYSCCWCDRTVEIRDDPQYGWNFCPKCGKSWFTRLECRETTMPRWWYDRFHDPDRERRVKLSNGEEVGMYSLQMLCNARPEQKASWVFDRRVRWPNSDWGQWELEFTNRFDPHHNYLWAKSMLVMFRNHDKDSDMICEYKVRIDRK